MRTEDGYFINKCLNGDSTAFGLLVDRYKESVFAIAYSKLGNFHDAEDATQEVFARAYSKLRTLRRWDSFRVWIYTMTLNYCKMQLRSRANRPDREFIEDQNIIAIQKPYVDSGGSSQMDDTLHEALRKLPEIYRQVIILHYLGGMSTGEIAQSMGISPGAVRVRLSRARTELKEGILTMMSRTFEEHRLPTGFTFRIIEIIKHIKIKVHPMSRITGLSWGISSAAWVLLAIMGIGLNPSISNPVDEYIRAVDSSLPGDMAGLRTGELFIPADIMKSPELTAKSEKPGNTYSNAPGQKDNRKAFALAPMAEGGKWERKADMPTGRCNLVTGVVNGRIYAITGFRWGDNFSLPTTEEYNPLMDTWTRKADKPIPRDGPAIGVLDGKIYVIGGAPTRTEVEVYDPQTDKWERKADMPNGRGYLSAGVVNGKIYAIGGGDYRTNKVNAIVEEYNPATDIWTRKADMPTARWYFGIGVVNDKIYAIGGNAPPEPPTPIVEEYDPATDTWIRKADMPTARASLSTTVVNGKIYAIGGGIAGGDFNLTSAVEVYNPSTDKWEKEADMPTARGYFSSCSVNGKIYAIGGTTKFVPNKPAESVIATVEEYTPEGWPFNAIFPQNNLPSTWGEQKRER